MMEPIKDEEMATMPAEGMTQEDEQAANQMEQLMGNYLDLPDKERKIAEAIILGSPASILDKVLGVPLFTRIQEQINTNMGAADGMAQESAVPVEEPMTGEGIMAEAPMEEAPMEDEEEEMIL